MDFFTRKSKGGKAATITERPRMTDRLCDGCQDALFSIYHAETVRTFTAPSLYWETEAWKLKLLGLCGGYSGSQDCAFRSTPWLSTSCELCRLFRAENEEYMHFLQKVWTTRNDAVILWKQKRVFQPQSSENKYNFRQIWAEVVGFSIRNQQVVAVTEWTSAKFMAEELQHETVRAPPRLANSTGSPQTFQTIRQWMQSCDQSHAKCRRLAAITQPEKWRPLRLLDLRALDRGIVYFDIREENFISATQTLYASLSYSWGKHGNFKLESHALLKSWLATGIPLARFPKTMQDAMHCARQLETDFLWIDAVCLIQSPVETWQKEAVDMHKVYGYARFNIVANSSPGPYHGLFSSRDASSASSYGLTWSAESVNRGNIFKLRIHANDPWQQLVEKSFTSCRAWVFQEEMLAQRRIDFGADQVFWHCAQFSACETHPTGRSDQVSQVDLLKTDFDSLRIQYKWGTRRQAYELGTRKDGHRAFELLWSIAVESFTARDITWASDRLIATAGVAAAMQAMSPGNTYHAGLWSKHMEWFLCWRSAHSGRGRTRRIVPHEAPTWSWGSVTGAVKMDIITGDTTKDVFHGDHNRLYDTYQDIAYIYEAETTLQSGSGPTGKVSASWILLIGYLINVEYAISGGESDSASLRFVGASSGDHVTAIEHHCHLDDIISIEGDLYFLPLLLTEPNGLVPTHKPKVRGILVQPDRRRGCFHRIGYLDVRTKLSALSSFLTPSGKQPAMPRERYVEWDGASKQYKFYLV